ncbi:MAG: acyltransferase [Collinsella sp.]
MGKIIVKQGATICAAATILLAIGENAIVGANAAATKSIPDNEIWVGVPARYLKTRDPQD